MQLFGAAPVGLPGLIAIGLGGALFFANLLRTRRRAGGPAEGDRRSGASQLGILLQMAGFALTGMGPLRAVLPAASAAAIGGAAAVAALMAGAVLLFTAASRAMGANWSLTARVREAHELVRDGIFARLRHPIYTAMALFLAAEAIAFGHYTQLMLGVPLFLLGTAIRVREEERLLRDRFGEAYDAYAARVKRFLPGIA